MTDMEIVEGIKAKLNAALKDVSSLNRKSACDLISEGVHGISILQFLIARIRKDMAKEILNVVDSESNGQTIPITNCIRRKYGVEVNK